MTTRLRTALSRDNVRYLLDILSTGALVVAAVLVARMALRQPTAAATPPRQPLAVPVQPVSTLGAPSLGVSDARAVLVVFSDFQCPFCAKFSAEVLPSLKERYVDTKLLRIAFRHFPLEDIHPRARSASEAAACANSSGQFWPMHDLLFRSPQALDDASIVEHARALKLDPQVLVRCRAAEGPEFISRDLAQGRALGVYSTPSFFVGRPLDAENIRIVSTVMGAQPLKDFEASILAVIDGAS